MINVLLQCDKLLGLEGLLLIFQRYKYVVIDIGNTIKNVTILTILNNNIRETKLNLGAFVLITVGCSFF